MSSFPKPPGRGYRPLGSNRDSLRVENSSLKRNIILFIFIIITIVTILIWIN